MLQTKTGAALVSRLLLLAAAALFIAVLFGAYARTAPAGADGDADGAKKPAEGEAEGDRGSRTSGT